ncbi:branched-chain amino acid ABC transporter permease [Desulfosporosinus fructosivorans]|uniref:Branched-chain amino acid ABC transporter permease n=1 Tax=Desulfosporosinus fructosivorans TaxID=2018669 RepID=A0A4Z0R971_9FIRM|nr:branched-chain amino acid ABC transporter permease [Desulfosporosinus fructosivorans]TGE39751.1 branched-chain amino acid ABC transporter permease [Desulfosporosinus fructosivorans]
MRKNYKLWALIISILLLAAIPLVVDQFFITMLIRIMYFGLLSVAFTFLAGQLGLFSLMVPVFMGISAYTIAILESKEILLFPYSVLVALGIILAFAALAGFLVNRSKEVYFLMLTLVLGQLVWAIVLQWVSLTKGTNGISGIEVPHLWGLGQGSNVGFYYYTLAVFSLVVLGLTAIMRSSFGLKLRGIRESESRMIMLGYNVALLKWAAFMISSFIAGLAGIFYVYYSGLINPDSISLNSANQVMIASIFGGVNSIIGAILGTGIIKTLEIVLSGSTQRYLLIIGILFLVVIMFAPKGVIDIMERVMNKLWKGSPYDKRR